ncbi:MAG: hypothetical protein MJY83_04985 [Bacteroidales bacterium]|nr:hypothetical protein [Bacteroidales bacterium]
MPQIELMLSDLPHTLYRIDRKDNWSEAEALQLEANKKAEQRRRRAEGYAVEEIFDGLAD